MILIHPIDINSLAEYDVCPSDGTVLLLLPAAARPHTGGGGGLQEAGTEARQGDENNSSLIKIFLFVIENNWIRCDQVEIVDQASEDSFVFNYKCKYHTDIVAAADSFQSSTSQTWIYPVHFHFKKLFIETK